MGGQESSIKNQVSGIKYQESSIRNQVSGIKYQESSIKKRQFYLTSTTIPLITDNANASLWDSQLITT